MRDCIRWCAASSALGATILAGWAAAAETSLLWGEAAELWSPESRLPDFSFAGLRVRLVTRPLQVPEVQGNFFGVCCV